MKWAQLLIFGTIGFVLLYFGFLWGIEAYPVFRDNVMSQGTVVDLYADPNGKRPEAVIPVIEFTLRDNTKVRFHAKSVSKDDPAYEKSAVVDVLYNPKDPGKTRLGSYKQLLQVPMLAGGVGLVLIFLSLLLFNKIGSFERTLDKLGSDKQGKER